MATGPSACLRYQLSCLLSFEWAQSAKDRLSPSSQLPTASNQPNGNRPEEGLLTGPFPLCLKPCLIPVLNHALSLAPNFSLT